MRKEINLNKNWFFHKGDIKVDRPADKGPVYAQSKTERKKIGPAAYHYHDRPDDYGNECEKSSTRWYRVDLPHDYIVEQDNDQTQNNSHGYFKYENAWYRKHFEIDPEFSGKRITLRFDGIATCSTVYLNGCLMGRNYSAYNSFEIDITSVAFFDKENVLSVYVNTEEFEGWWYQGGGIYRDVTLTVTENVAIDLWGVYAPYEKIGDNTWQVNFETTVINASFEDVSVTAKTEIIDKSGNTVAVAEGGGAVSLRDKATLKYFATVEDPELWDCDNPNLYSVETRLYKDDEEIDINTTRIGFRTVEISVEKGLLLNGKPTFINGVCAHQDFGLTGLAVPRNIAFYKVGLMKEMGANGFRTSHYQHSADYMDAFDEMGFLVMNEARWFESTPEAMLQLESLLRRDRNRPSVIMWSTSNEEPSHITEQGRRTHKAIAAHIRKFDKQRYICAAVDRNPEKCTIYDDCELVGINYNLGIYDTVHKMKPEKPIFASECCATGTSRDWNFSYNTFGRLRDKDRDTNAWFKGRENTYKFLRERPWVFGCFQWDAVEHRGEAEWPAVCSKSGAMDLFLQKKGAFYQNKSHWTDDPMVHIVPHWNFLGLEGQDVLVTVYTNCDELEVILNGEIVDRKTIEKYGHGEWNIPYVPGTLTVKGYRDGAEVATHSRTTTGRPEKLKLTALNEIKANGKDIALFLCECIDELGRPVPDAAEQVYFSTAEPAKIIGTGSDNTDHRSVKNVDRKMYMGKILVGVKPREGQTELELTALSDNCGVTACKIKL